MKSAAFALTLLSTPLAAQDLIVQFADTAPGPNISLHAAGCTISNAILLIDLGGSQDGYRFDASQPEPVAITHGYGALSPVRSGDTRLQLLVRSLDNGDTFDLQAALANSGNGGADGSGIQGATVRVADGNQVVTGVFDAAGTARLALPADGQLCLAAAE